MPTRKKLLIIIIIIIIIPRSLEIPGWHPAGGIAMSYGQIKRSLALVGNHLEMVPR